MKRLRIVCATALAVLFTAGCASGAGGHEPLLTLVHVSGGSFLMGSEDGPSAEQPVHEVRVESFYVSAYEITQGQWFTVMGTNPRAERGEGDNYPVYNVTWYDAAAFCNRLSEMEGYTPAYSGTGSNTVCDFTADGYRLPTEAEWEYAARGGASSQNHLYAGSDDPDEVAWYSDNAENATHEVGLKAPNELGLYDMSGNVWEQTGDWFDARFYAESGSENPTGPDSGTYRVLRGGSWGINVNGIRTTNRYMGTHRSDSSTGFRVVRPDR